MVRKLFVFAFGVMALSACAAPPPAAPDTAADEAKIKAVSAVWFDHVAAGDPDAVANLYAEDAVVLPDKAPALVGRAAFREYVAGMLTEMKAQGLSLKNGPEVSAGVSGDLGWVSGTYTFVDATGKTVDTGKYLSVHRRGTGDWLYIRDTWNSDIPAPPAPEAVKKEQ
jgi:uncharacterized protein (TIGR02246 family)